MTPPDAPAAPRARNGTAEQLARQFGVSVRTVYNAAKFAAAVDLIEKVYGPEAKADILAGKYKRKTVMRSAEMIRRGELP